MAAINELERSIRHLCEMGVSRSAAKSALRACRGDLAEAATVVFDERHCNAADIPSDDETVLDHRDTGGKGKRAIRIPTPDNDEEEGFGSVNDFTGEVEESSPAEETSGDEQYDNEQDEYAEDADIFSDHDEVATDTGSVDYGDGDAYGFINMSKDRKEVVKEVEMPIKQVWISSTARGEYPERKTEKTTIEAEMIGLGRWLSGCPEGNEQQLLFSLYNTLSGDSWAGHSKCPHGCGTIIEHHESDFFAVPADFQVYLDRLLKIARVSCPGCRKGICLACNDKVEINEKAKAPQLKIDEGHDSLLHCPNMQAVILGVGLFLVDRLWNGGSDGLHAVSNNQIATPQKRKVTPSDGEESETGPSNKAVPSARNGQHTSGIGYGGRGRDDDSGQNKALKVQQERDEQLAGLLALVRVYLPNRDRLGVFRNSDHMPAGQTLAHLRRRFNPVASNLLSNESLSDMSERTKLYTEFMTWLELMSRHENLSGIMGQPIMRVTFVEYEEGLDASNGRGKDITYEASPGPRELLEKIVVQVNVAKRVADVAKQLEERERQAQLAYKTKSLDGQSPIQSPYLPTNPSSNLSTSNSFPPLLKDKALKEGHKLVEFCEIILKAVDKIDRALGHSKRGQAVLKSLDNSRRGNTRTDGSRASGQTDAKERGPKSDDGHSKLTDEEIKKVYEKWAKEVNYDYSNWELPEDKAVPDDRFGPKFKHTYSKEARAISSFPARNTALMKEHTVLSSSLPASWDSSVFLRVDEGRSDVIKALIIGPEGTPYENGCFLFDILLPAGYNASPPTVKSLTSLGGVYRLNPNLYADGKVCLSLLGTWKGPGWVAGRSSLLQVLISIQAMILCSEPIGNEPSGSIVTRFVQDKLMPLSVHTGFEKEVGTARSKAYNANVRRMVVKIAMLEYLKNPVEGFQDIISKHFKLKARSLRKQLDRWLQEDDHRPLCKDSMNSLHTRYGGGGSGTGSGSAFVENVEAFKELLDKLERGQ